MAYAFDIARSPDASDANPSKELTLALTAASALKNFARDFGCSIFDQLAGAENRGKCPRRLSPLNGLEAEQFILGHLIRRNYIRREFPQYYLLYGLKSSAAPYGTLSFFKDACNSRVLGMNTLYNTHVCGRS